MTIDPNDAYAPKKTGVHNVSMKTRSTDPEVVKT